MDYSEITGALNDFATENRNFKQKVKNDFLGISTVFDSLPLIEDKWEKSASPGISTDSLEISINAIQDPEEKASCLRKLTLHRAESEAFRLRLQELYALMQVNGFMDLMA